MSTMAAIHPHITVLRSECPDKDAATILRLLPDLFELEKKSDDLAVLFAKQETNPSVRAGLLLMLVRARGIHEITPLVASEKQIRAAQEACNGEGASLKFTRAVKIASGDKCTLCSIQLQGGATILLVPPELARSPEGREILVRAMISPETVQNENGCVENGFVDIQVVPDSLNESWANGKAIMQEADSEYPLPKFPTLDVRLLGKNGELQPDFPLNSPVAIPVETDLFIGRMMLILRPPNPEDDPYWNERIFSERKRRVVFQLQGKFKRTPNGTVYAGGEVSDQMRLGLVAKGVCGILLKLVKSFAPNVHYSFGDSGDKEKPHIVIPAWSFFERLVVTKPGEEIPILGEEFVEPKESVAARKAFKSKPQWNTEDTYSMSFYSMYMDFAKWQIVQLPVGDVDLKTFWGKSSLTIVLYENETPPKDDRHLQLDNKYYFGIQMKFLGHAPRQAPSPLPWEKARPTTRPRTLSDRERQDSGSFLLSQTEQEEFFFDAEEESSLHEIEDETIFVPESSQSMTSLNLLLTIDSVCPTMIEMYHKGKYVKVFAFNLTKEGVTVFRRASFSEEYFVTDEAKEQADNMWSPRLSSSERYRRIVGQCVSQALTEQNPKDNRLHRFTELRTEFDSEFLRKEKPSWAHKRRLDVRKATFGARAISDRHWLEEWIQITDRFVFFHHPDKAKPHFRVCLRSIVDVKLMPSDDMPLMPAYSFLAIETLGRTDYLMFCSEIECREWVDLITGLIAMRRAADERAGPIDSQSVGSEHSMAFDDPADEFLQKSSLWNCKQRRILNGRKFSFRTQDSHQTNDPASLVEDALVRALEQGDDFDEGSMIAFLDSAAALKDVDVNHLREEERLTFFLNLYHTMIMHAYLVLGMPDSSFKWISYFNTISYQCSDDIFSLTELEHCIIRAAMNYPSQFVSKFVLPKSQYRFALTKADYRINFALNCGSTSNPDAIPIYKTKILDRQLDAASRQYMAYSAEVHPSTRRAGAVTVTLPRICQWFAEDFGNGSTNDVVLSIERFLNDDQCKLLATCFSEREQRFNSSDLNVKYLAYSFECRYLRLEQD